MSLLETTLVNLAAVVGLMTVVWILSVLKRDASIVDPVWGLGFALVGGVTMLVAPRHDPHGYLLMALVMIWGVRLSAYLVWRNHGKGEDRRYASMRSKHGDQFWWISFFTVFLLQALLIWFVSLPVQVGVHAQGPVMLWLVAIGVGLWLIGFGFETIGDYQMAKFKADPANDDQVMDDGLWRYTRHPNYFGDFCLWWGHYLVAAAAGAWWTVLSPVAMSFLLMKVSGVTLLESDIEERRPEYEEYKRKTNTFFPGPPG